MLRWIASQSALVFAPILLAGACVPIGSAALRSDQIAYADAIGDANKRLALSNIVKLRYGDTPTFLVTSQVVAGYQLQTSATVGTDFVNEVGAADLRFNNVTLGVAGSFSNNPTITYSPVRGADFGALLLAPISPADLFGLILGGVPPDLVLGLGLAQINGERNRLLLRPDSAATERRFTETVELMLELQEAGLLQFRFEGEGTERAAHLVLSDGRAGKAEPEGIAKLRELLELTPGKVDFPIIYGSGKGAPDSIRVLTRSISEIMRDLASQLEVPQEDVALGRTPAKLAVRAPPPVGVRLAVQVSELPPLLHEVFAGVRYRGRWYWIANTDFGSKRVLSFLLSLLNLAETGTEPGLPVITIPAG
jgi:hypothetical protein